MTGEQTAVSKVLSHVVEGASLMDLLLVVAAAVALTGLLLPTVPHWAGLALVTAGYGALHVSDYKENNDVRKNGGYSEVVEGSRVSCSECKTRMNKKEGYTVYYVAGYEVVRVKDFTVELCDSCTSMDGEDRGEQDASIIESALELEKT